MKINHKRKKNLFDEKNVKISRNIMNEKPLSELGEKTSENFYSGNNSNLNNNYESYPNLRLMKIKSSS